MFALRRKFASFVRRARGQVLEATTGLGRRQATFCWTGILGSRVDRAVPEAGPLFVFEKEENSREERSMARRRV